MLVTYIHIKSREKVPSAQSKGAQSTFGLSTFDVVVDLPPPHFHTRGGVLPNVRITDKMYNYFSCQFP